MDRVERCRLAIERVCRGTGRYKIEAGAGLTRATEGLALALPRSPPPVAPQPSRSASRSQSASQGFGASD